MKNTQHKKGISIRWKLAAFMAVFVALVLLITWFFQIFLLGTFYRSIKKDELERAAEELAWNIQSDNLEEHAFNAAVKHSLCVMIYRLTPSSAEELVNVDATGGMLVSLSSERLDAFYKKAQKNGGCYSSKIIFGGHEISDDFLDALPFPNDTVGEERIPIQKARMLYVQLEEVSESEQYMILLDASLQPLDSTVKTLSRQNVWIGCIIFMIAVVMVLILYRHISNPIVRMNASAKRLAQGKYDVVFSGQGYLEAHELADTLNYASCELSKLDSLQKELIANISHDLRTPLTMIRGYAEVVRDIPGENTPENMQVIIDETTRLSELVNDLLDLSRIQSGTQAPIVGLFDLTDAVQEVLTRYDVLVKHRGYCVDFAFDCSAFVYADRSMILQALYNLINNAINYTGDDKRVTVTQTVANGEVTICVTDSGEGIAEKELPLIWDRYYKVDKVHRSAMVGTGLGLSIVKEILEKHNAKYGVESKIGEGSTFWFVLPIAKDAADLGKDEQEE